MRVKEWSLVLFSSAALAACGGGETGTTSTGAGGGSSTSSSTGTGGAAADAPYGYIDIDQTPATDSGQVQWGGTVNAGFVDHTEGMSNGTCDSSMFGECSVILCYDAGAGGGGTGSKLVFAGAGDLTVDGLTDQNGDVTPVGPISPDVDMFYYTSFGGGDQKAFAGGETITVKASGGQLAAFSVSATAPHLITLTTPDLADTLVMNASFDLPVTWMNGKDGTVGVYLTASVTDMGKDGIGFVSCAFPASAGKGVVPTAVLQKLLAVPGTEISGQINVGVSSHATVTVGETEIEMSVTGNAAEGQSFKLH